MDKQRQQPSKESVRNWLRSEIAQRRPPPDPAQIRRELNWDLVRIDKDERGEDERDRKGTGHDCSDPHVRDGGGNAHPPVQATLRAG